MRFVSSVWLAQCFWFLCFVFDMALAYESMVEDTNNGFLVPAPRQQLPSLLFIMLAYTAGIPGVPFTVASIMGWGVLITTILQHLLLWSSQPPTIVIVQGDDYVSVLGMQLMRIVLFNAFGTFVGVEQTRQMRLNFWHVCLLQEAVQLHKLCRQRFHRLTANTLPAPIVKAIATGDTAFVKVYDGCTVLQADMVGFTPLSARFPPEKVLGILSDIFEEFDSLCETNGVDKVKTIGDAYIVCAGALSDKRRDDAQRVVRMGLAMQHVVTRIATHEGIDIAVRIGVHTGRCTGGIIGTVRFHFDMWGGAVVGAVKMEETGERGRVHISDSTYKLIADHFESAPHLSQADLGDWREQDVRQTYLVGNEIERPAYPPDFGGGDTLEDEAGVGEMPRKRSSVGGLAHGLRAPARAVLWSSKFKAARREAFNSRREKTRPNGRSPPPSLFGTRQRDSNEEPEPPNESYPSPSRPSPSPPAVRERQTSNFFVDDNAPTAPRPSHIIGGVTVRPSIAGTKSSTKSGKARPSFFARPASPGKASTPGAGPSGGGARQTAADGTGGGATDMNSPRSTNLLTTSARGSSASGSGNQSPRNPVSSASGSARWLDRDTTEESFFFNGDQSEKPHLIRINPEGASHIPPPPPPGGAPGDASNPGSQRKLTTLQESVKQQKEADRQSAGVRILFDHAVRSALRRSALVTSVVYFFFGIYDWLVWNDQGAVTSFYLMRYLGCVPAAAIPTLVVTIVHKLKPQHLPFVNLLLLFLPWLCTCALVLMAPNRGRQYMLTLLYFQIWSGYTMLSLQTTTLTCLQLFFSFLYGLAEWTVLDFPALGESFRPSYIEVDPICRVDVMPHDMTMIVYILCAHLLGVQHNRRRRRNLRNHAKLLVSQEDRMARISEEVDCCEQLLQNVFPAPVLARLQNTQGDGGATGGGGQGSSFAEKFHDCTFLFAKIVGLKVLTELGEKGERDPAQVVAALQLIFDRFDRLADTFKVQKVRKTVNEYYMVAAGLPDPMSLPNVKERALAMVALAFSMVHVMDVINSDALILELGVELQCQVGIHSGDAIAGVIGHKRFQYDLCGDAVNTAARMCSYSAPGCINVSPTTLALVRSEYGALYRGERAVKGKGNMALYFLTGRLNPAMLELMEVPSSEDADAAAAKEAAAKAAALTKAAVGGDASMASPSRGVVGGVVGALGGALGSLTARISQQPVGVVQEPACESIIEESLSAATSRATSGRGTCEDRASESGAASELTPLERMKHSPPQSSESLSDVYLSARGASTDSVFVNRNSVDTPSPRPYDSGESGFFSTPTPPFHPPMPMDSSSGLRVDSEASFSYESRTMSLAVPVPVAVQRDTRPPPAGGNSVLLRTPSALAPPPNMPLCKAVGSSAQLLGVLPPPVVPQASPALSASSVGSVGNHSMLSRITSITSPPQSSVGDGVSERVSVGSSSISVEELRACDDPTRRQLHRMCSATSSALASHVDRAVIGLRANTGGRAREASINRARQESLSRARQASTASKHWDQSALVETKAAAAMGGDIDIGLQMGSLEPPGILRSLSVGARPRYSQGGRGGQHPERPETVDEHGEGGSSDHLLGTAPGTSQPPSLPPTPPDSSLRSGASAGSPEATHITLTPYSQQPLPNKDVPRASTDPRNSKPCNDEGTHHYVVHARV